MPKLRDSRNRLTSYALACGYLEQIDLNGVRVTLWMENGCESPYHVRAHDFNEHLRKAWECFETLAEARRFFRTCVKLYVP